MEKITFDKRNYRRHDEKNKRVIRKSLEELGAGRSVVIDKDGALIAGNGVYEQAQKLKMPVRVVETDGSELVVVKRTDLATGDEKRKRLALADNVASDLSDFDDDLLHEDFSIEELSDWGLENEEKMGYKSSEPVEKLSDRFIVPPFSVLDGRAGYWVKRKKWWLDRIGDNGESRSDVLSGLRILHVSKKGFSILDPVLAEVACKWFGIDGGTAFDCFAGDTVFGYVASQLGLSFTGIELREEQVKLNNDRTLANARYICDDGRNVRNHIQALSQDFFFSCPPYYDLEVYSDLSNDASNQQTYSAFLEIIESAFLGAIDCLRNNRFAVVVVSDIRDKEGAYRCFCDDVKAIFRKGGCVLYNEAILIDPVGSAMLRAGNYMKSRKLVKTHQNMLVFYKGNIKDIQKNYKEIKYESADLESFGMASDE